MLFFRVATQLIFKNIRKNSQRTNNFRLQNLGKMSVIDMKPALTVRTRPERTFLDIVQRYSPLVLNENWFEERLKFVTEKYPPAKSITASHFTYEQFQERDFTQAMDNYEKNKGIQKDFMFHHHGKVYLNPICSTYKFDYRHPYGSINSLPFLFGLHQKYLDHKEQSKSLSSPQSSETCSSYKPFSSEFLANKHYGIRKDMSTQLYPPNFINRETYFRNKKMLIAPEYMTIPQLNITEYDKY
ncbi:uncharacterized protein [Centruroides vittatus]|uniref:uncharacterized protein n=1 Tax=Centruroides vittatus TaxID=120091 RepID=UPI00350F3FF4